MYAGDEFYGDEITSPLGSDEFYEDVFDGHELATPFGVGPHAGEEPF